MNYKIESFPIYKNLKAKLKNINSDLNWYAFRICQIYKIEAGPKDALNTIRELERQQVKLPTDLLLIIDWAETFEKATPKNADDLFHACGRFLLRLDLTDKKGEL